MPHDRDGRVLSVGDDVLVPCHVKELHMTEEFCNVTLETSQPMYPSENRSGIVLNAKQVVKGVAGEPLEPVGEGVTDDAPIPEAVAAETADVANEAANADPTAEAK